LFYTRIAKKIKTTAESSQDFYPTKSQLAVNKRNRNASIALVNKNCNLCVDERYQAE